MCERYPNFKFYNADKDVMTNFKCHTFRCPECSQPKRRQFYVLLMKIMKSWHMRRLWTFTLTSRHMTPEQHYKVFNECIRRLTTYLRRSKMISPLNKSFSYIRLNELHESGYVHAHIVINQFLDFHLVQGLFKSIFITVINKYASEFNLSQEILNEFENTKCTNVVLSKNLPTKTAVKYIIKYVTKSVGVSTTTLKRIYSKSNDVKIWPKKEPSGDAWYLLKFGYNREGFLYLFLNSLTSQLLLHYFLSSDDLIRLLESNLTKLNE